MAKRGHSEEEILRVLLKAESGTMVVEVCRKHGISQQSCYLWKKKYSGLGLSELRELRQLARAERQGDAPGCGPQPGPAHPAGDRRKKAYGLVCGGS
jgi:putative transposase